MGASLPASFPAHCSTCERENSLNWFIHRSRESHSQRSKGSCKALNLTSEENARLVLNTAGTRRWRCYTKGSHSCECATRLIINKREDESVTEEAATDSAGHGGHLLLHIWILLQLCSYTDVFSTTGLYVAMAAGDVMGGSRENSRPLLPAAATTSSQ